MKTEIEVQPTLEPLILAQLDGVLSSGFVALESVTVVDFAVVAKPKVRNASLDNLAHIANRPIWGPVIITAVLTGALTFLGQMYFRSSDRATTASDEHVNQLIATATVGRLDTINSRLADLAGKIEHVQGQVDEMNERAKKIATEQDRLTKRVDGQEAIVRLQDPRRILATIRGEIETAEKEHRVLAASQLADYRIALRELPNYKVPSQDSQLMMHFWLTVAAVINYQSLLNRMSGEAPDPAKVAEPCAITSPYATDNAFDGSHLRNCVIYIDKNSFNNVTFENSVIHYRGGPVALNGVQFINCTFVLEFAGENVTPASNLMLALLDSPDQKTVQVPG